MPARRPQKNYKKRRKDSFDKPSAQPKRKTGVVEIKGVIEETLPNSQYRVQLEGGQVILAHLSGKMRIHHIKVLNGDHVTVQMTPYDLTKGRIVRRDK